MRTEELDVDGLAGGDRHVGEDRVVAEHEQRLHEAEPEVHPEVAVYSRAHHLGDFFAHRRVTRVRGEVRGASWGKIRETGKLSFNLVNDFVPVAHAAQPDVRKDLDALVDQKQHAEHGEQRQALRLPVPPVNAELHVTCEHTSTVHVYQEINYHFSSHYYIQYTRSESSDTVHTYN